MRVLRFAPPVLSLLLAACAQAQLLEPLPVGTAADVRLDEGVANGVTAVVGVTLPEYQLKSVVHRWVAGDITEYDVNLRVKNGASYDELPTPMNGVLPVTGGVAPKAIFQNLQQGHVYRAFVTAKHGSTVINGATAATADFDFSGTQDVNATLNRSVTVVLDGVDFNGTGNLSFNTPADGGFNAPSASPTITVVTPTPGPAGVTGAYTVGHYAYGVAIDPSGNAWVTGQMNHDNLTKLSSTGSVLGIFSLANAFDIASDTSGNMWITASAAVYEVSPAGSVLGTVSVSGAYSDAVDPTNGHVWVTSTSGALAELSSTGSLLGTFSAGTFGAGVAVDAGGNVWVANNDVGAPSVIKLSSTGSLIGTYSSGVTGPGGTTPYSVAIDGSGNVWVVNKGSTSTVEKLSSTGSVLGIFTTGSQSYDIAIDASNRAWVTNQNDNSVTELSSTGSILGTFTGSMMSTMRGIAVAPTSGFVWAVSNYIDGSLDGAVTVIQP